jgi:hypothetical protein
MKKEVLMTEIKGSDHVTSNLLKTEAPMSL